jgi:polyhydroxybutyrate depolymerase
MRACWLAWLLLCASPACLAALTDETLDIDGTSRRFLVHDYSQGKPTSLVILLHGGGGSGQNMVEQTGFDGVAQREGLIAVYPYGSSALFSNQLLTWNAGHCCAYALREKVDDVQFLRSLIDHLIATRNVDPTRVYVTGLSNGGMMTHRVGIALADKVAAIAPVISSVFGDEPERYYAMPVLLINGSDDVRVKVEGGDLEGFGIGPEPADLPTKPVAAQGDYWARVNGCKAFTDTSTPLYTLRSWSGCRVGGAVQSYLVNDQGHAWPGGTQGRSNADKPVTTVDANELIWAFFKQFQRHADAVAAADSYYYVGELHVPAFSAGSTAYRARLDLSGAVPIEFAVQRLTPLPAGTATASGSYDNGILRLTSVVVGSARYNATLLVLPQPPLRLRVLELL